MYSGPQQYRSIWISDIHLGTNGCKADFLLDFLKHTDSEYLYLVGDIVDIWRLKKSWAWKQSHNDVLQKLLRKARKGTKVIYLPGNHDEMFREFLDLTFGLIEVHDEKIHVMRDGRKFLVLHGDQYDVIVRYNRWLAIIGDQAYDMAITLNTYYNRVRRMFGYPYWSLSSFLKMKAKKAVEFIASFEHALVEEAQKRELDGVICGHIHNAEIKDIEGITYCNDGDWVESCTALVEHMDGRLEILNWAEIRQLSFAW